LAGSGQKTFNEPVWTNSARIRANAGECREQAVAVVYTSDRHAVPSAEHCHQQPVDDDPLDHSIPDHPPNAALTKSGKPR